MAVQTMREGACDFLQKPIKQETFLPAIERAIKKDRQARAGATDMIHERHILASLTASRLNISKRTVDVIRTAALKKLALENLMN